MALDIVLNESTVMNYLESEVEFPVDFDQAWQWAGYSTKHKALLKLKKHFSDSEDFTTKRLKNSSAGRPSDSYYLTNDCFKMFCMMAGTEKGAEVRRYYIQCEKTLKAQRQQAKTPALPSYAQEIHILTDALRILKLEDSPRHLQLVRDKFSNLLDEGTQTLAIAPVRWFGVVEIAEQLGYDPYAISKLSSGLGRVVASWYRSKAGCEPRTEERIINGRMCEPKVYQRSDELDSTISSYLENKGLKSA
jgi:phage anti-repressor protein